MSNAARFRIAVRIHYALKHHLGEGIDVNAMLKQPNEAREVLFVCQALGTPELLALAHRYVVALDEEAAVATTKLRMVVEPGTAPQDASWANNTTGFGVSQPAELQGHHQEPPSRGWFSRRDPRRDLLNR
ncbi:MAG TPA: hypothetical protein VE029_08895 [Rhizobacter sp.]|nr:hypothetical protein [Rhizobacter sp.]